MRCAYFDLVGGAAGDMLLAALLDAGAAEGTVRDGLASLPLSGFQLQISRVQRQGLAASRVEVLLQQPEAHPHRHLSDVLKIVEGGGLSPRVVERARLTFRALAVAEGRVHGISPEEVHFHEVGAVDAIVDVVGVCLALESLGIDRLECSPFPLGQGQLQAAHGTFPLPAPATLALIESRGAPVVGRGPSGELVTPTGAALLTSLSQRFGAWPSLLLERVGYGAGSREETPAGTPPNVVRVALGTPPAPETPGEVVILETNLDDQTPESIAFVAERLREQGALEAFLTPVQMKKGRPGVLLTVVSLPEQVGILEDTLLRETCTLGVRRRVEARTTLGRRFVTALLPEGEVRVKVATRPDGTVTYAPEYEDCARVARQSRLTLAEIYGAAAQAAQAQPKP